MFTIGWYLAISYRTKCILWWVLSKHTRLKPVIAHLLSNKRLRWICTFTIQLLKPLLHFTTEMWTDTVHISVVKLCTFYHASYGTRISLCNVIGMNILFLCSEFLYLGNIKRSIFNLKHKICGIVWSFIIDWHWVLLIMRQTSYETGGFPLVCKMLLNILFVTSSRCKFYFS